ncbi:hypothetical protein ACFLZV_00910 [Candidatus Margulisiibacteriota bacterium]
MFEKRYMIFALIILVFLSFNNVYAKDPVVFSNKTKAEDVIQINGLVSKYFREKRIEESLWGIAMNLSLSVEAKQEFRTQGFAGAFISLNSVLIDMSALLPSEVIAMKYNGFKTGADEGSLEMDSSFNKIAFLETTGIVDQQNKINIAASLYTLGGTTLLAGFGLQKDNQPLAYITSGLLLGFGLAVQNDWITNIFSFEKYAGEFQKEADSQMSMEELNKLADTKIRKIIEDERYWINGFALLSILSGITNENKVYGAVYVAKGVYDAFFAKGPIERMMSDYKSGKKHIARSGIQGPGLFVKGNDVGMSVSYTF